MSLKICTWNINSVRLREELVLRFLDEEAPDILCLQELKSPAEKIPTQSFRDAGYVHMVARGQKGYNGVAILSRIPIEDAGHKDFCEKGDARHVSAKTSDGLTIHNFYVPAGGDTPDTDANPKFAHKLAFLDEMTEMFSSEALSNAILVGDLNIAPREDDVWNHKALLKVVSHTPVEVERLARVQTSADWVDLTRKDIPDGHLYSWWSYRSPSWDTADKGRRLDHIWGTPDIAPRAHGSSILRDVRGWDRPSDHAPVVVLVD